MTAFENLSASQKLRASLHRDVRAICTESLHLLGMEMTKAAMEIVAELLYRKLSLYGTDLEAFAKHAKRNTVNAEDVKLLVRRNPSLKTRLNTIQPSNPLAKDKRRKTVATAAIPFATPVTKPKETPRPNTDGKRNEEGDKRRDSGEGVKEIGEDVKDLGDTRNLGEGSSKDDNSIDRIIADQVENMSVDTIDLTFD